MRNLEPNEMMFLLFVVFFTCRLLGVISWPWYMVALPLYFPFAVLMGMALMCIGFSLGLRGVIYIIKRTGVDHE